MSSGPDARPSATTYDLEELVALADCAADVVRDVETRWPNHADALRDNRTLVDTITESIRLRARSLRRAGAPSV